jgi:hypothetical protein
MQYPTTDNECTMLGWTELMLDSDCVELHISVPQGTDLDGTFLAFCHDEQEMIKVNGWLFTSEEI